MSICPEYVARSSTGLLTLPLDHLPMLSRLEVPRPIPSDSGRVGRHDRRSYRRRWMGAGTVRSLLASVALTLTACSAQPPTIPEGATAVLFLPEHYQEDDPWCVDYRPDPPRLVVSTAACPWEANR